MRRTVSITGVVLGVLLLLVAAALAAAQPLARWETRRLLAGLRGMRGTFDSVQVRVRDLSYAVKSLRLDKVGPGGRPEPFFRAGEARVSVYGRELVRGHLVATVELAEPRLTLVESERPSERRSPREAGGVAEYLQHMHPLRFDRVQVKGGEVRWVDAREPEKPVLRLHGIEATAENIASRESLARKEPTVLAGRATLQRTGQVQVFATADPLAKGLTFAGQGSVRSMALDDLATFLESKSEVKATKGTIDVYARFAARDGALSGGVRPVVQGADLEAAKPGLGPKLKALLGDVALKIFKDDETGKVATTIPIEGKVTGPQAQLVPTILGVLRNAFVEGLQAGLSGLPPPRSSKREGVLEQARRALSPGQGQPRAQPREERKP